MIDEQQQYMYDNKYILWETHCEHFMVMVAVIVREKVRIPVEFGVKFDISFSSEKYGYIEKILFEKYNESTCGIEVWERILI